MKLDKTIIEGCYLIHDKIYTDSRGKFIKPFNSEDFKRMEINFSIKEEYITISKLNVSRGMHF